MNNETNQKITLDLGELVEVIRSYDSEEKTLPIEKKHFVSEDFEINIKDAFMAIINRWWIVLISIVVFAVAFFGVSYRSYVPEYMAVAKMYVNNDNLKDGQTKISISSSDITAAQALVNSYCEILTSRLTLGEVISQMKENDDYNMTYEELYSKISCGAINETEVFYISVIDTDPQRAVTAVNTVVDVFPERIKDVIEGSSVKTIDRAVVAQKRNPGFLKQIAMGALVGAILSCAYAILRGCVFNDIVESSDWLSNSFDNTPVLAEIPDLYSVNNKGSYEKYGKYGRYNRGGTK